MRHSSLCFTPFVLTCAVLPGPLAAQPAPTQRPFCWHAAPKASCSVIILTKFGVYAFGGSRERVTGFDPVTGLPTGFSRPSRWFGSRRSLDLAVGMPVILRNGDALRSPYGLVKLNLDPRWGVALRPELRRSYSFSTAPPNKRSTLFLSAGVELGGWPDFALSSLGGAILGIVTLIHLGNSD